MLFMSLSLSFLLTFFQLNHASEILSSDICKNNGTLITLTNNSECFCGGLAHFGKFCEKNCEILRFFYGYYQESKRSFPEKCLEADCDEISFECTDVRLGFSPERPKNNIPRCEEEKTFIEKCYDETTASLYTNTFQQTPERSCLHNGQKLKHAFNSTCHCLGTQMYGSYCQFDCDKLGNTIPESCLDIKNPDCHLPRSCVDLSRKNIHINRCKNNTPFVVKKSGNACFCHGSGYYGRYCEKACPVGKPSQNCTNKTCTDDLPIDCIF